MGFSSYEVKCYLSLLEKATLTVSEVSKIAGIPRANAYEALERLMAKGLCVSKPGTQKRYSASDPELLAEKLRFMADETTKRALAALSKKKENLLKTNDTEKEKIVRLIDELKPLFKASQQNSNSLEYIEILKDPHQIHKKIMELAEGASSEVLAFTKPPYTGPPEKLQEQMDQEQDILKKNLTIKSIYEIATDPQDREWQLRIIDEAMRGGEEARVIETLPMKMLIFDEKTVLFALEDPVSGKPSLTTQVIEHKALATGLKILFETLWEQAEPHSVLEGLIKGASDD